MRRGRITAALTAAALLALTGCGSDDEGDAPGPDQASENADAAGTDKDDTTAALEQSVRDYTKALFAPDADAAYELLSERCKGETTAAEFEVLAEQAHNDYGALTIKTISVDEVSGDLARVSYGVGVPQFEREAQPWSREDGTWRWDAC